MTPPRIDRYPLETYTYHNAATKIIFRSPHLYFAAKLGDGPILVTDGFGGWSEVPRPKNIPISRWVGPGALKLKIPLLFDRVKERQSIEWMVRTIFDLGREGGGDEEPPVFRLEGSAMFLDRRWVLLETPETTNILRNRDGKLLRQEMTITVMEYVPSDQLDFRRLPKKKVARRIEAKKGDTINKIAQRLFKKKGKKKMRELAKEMAKLNKIRDRNKVLKEGRTIKVPA